MWNDDILVAYSPRPVTGSGTGEYWWSDVGVAGDQRRSVVVGFRSQRMLDWLESERLGWGVCRWICAGSNGRRLGVAFVVS